jgi:hypothetical protein
MIQAIWPAPDSKMYSEIRVALKLKTETGKPTLSKKEANKSWREDFLGIFSEEQKKEQKKSRQSKNNRKKTMVEDTE